MWCAPDPWVPAAAAAGLNGGSWRLPSGPWGRAAPARLRALADLVRRLWRRAWIRPRRGMAALASTHPESAYPDADRLEAPAAGRRLTAAEAARFREIMLPHLDAAYTLARYLSRDADAAGDIVQDAYVRAYRAFAAFRGASPRAWLLAIVRNCHHTWRDSLRRERLRRMPEPAPGPEGGEEAADAVDLLADDETPESILLRRAEADAVRALLEQMPEPLREALVLRELEELSYREIAEVAQVPVGTVMSRLSRARRLFAQLWAQSSEGKS